MKLFVFSCMVALAIQASAQQVAEIRRYEAPNATQAVAVDEFYFYTINNSRIVKREKATGAVITSWEGKVKHLNSGIILEGRLYCANSNYPETPMASSLEIFDPETLEHISTHSFGIFSGSFTWIDQFQGDWYGMFVHYENEARETGKGVEYSQLIRMDGEFTRKEAWVLPAALLERLRPYSISGGIFAEDGTLYLTSHHFEEMYLCRLPESGYELEWIDTLPVPFQGQGISKDPVENGVVYGIHRENNQVIVIQIE